MKCLSYPKNIGLSKRSVAAFDIWAACLVGFVRTERTFMSPMTFLIPYGEWLQLDKPHLKNLLRGLKQPAQEYLTTVPLSWLEQYRIQPQPCQYRTPRATPKPQIIDSQAATVTDPAGEEVHTNSYGDIKLEFHWDRYGLKNQMSSDWLRTAQGSAAGTLAQLIDYLK